MKIDDPYNYVYDEFIFCLVSFYVSKYEYIGFYYIFKSYPYGQPSKKILI